MLFEKRSSATPILSRFLKNIKGKSERGKAGQNRAKPRGEKYVALNRDAVLERLI